MMSKCLSSASSILCRASHSTVATGSGACTGNQSNPCALMYEDCAVHNARLRTSSTSLSRALSIDAPGSSRKGHRRNVIHQERATILTVDKRDEADDGHIMALRACLPNGKALTGDDWPVTRMGVISDEFWAAVESVMPSDEGKRGNRFGDHRLVLEGIAWRFRTGSPWRDLPADFGPWQRCGSDIIDGPWTAPTTRCSLRLRRYSGSMPRWPKTSRSCYRWIRRACGHINIARAHGLTRSPQGALSNYKKSPDEPDEHAIGRSRGGLTTKIHALTDQRQAPVVVRLTAGQAGDNPELVPLLDDYAAACRTRTAPVATFGCSPTRRIRIRARAANCVPEESNTPFPNAETRSLDGRPKDQPAVARPRSTPHSTGCATPSSAASTGSNSGAASRPATTSTP